jgi:hypothetical protein
MPVRNPSLASPDSSYVEHENPTSGVLLLQTSDKAGKRQIANFVASRTIQ